MGFGGEIQRVYRCHCRKCSFAATMQVGSKSEAEKLLLTDGWERNGSGYLVCELCAPGREERERLAKIEQLEAELKELKESK